MFILKILFSLFLPLQVLAVVQYTEEDIGEHNKPGDCWMIFEERVYDFSEYVPDHDRFMDIREWCGEDMTEDFKTKAGIGRDHKEFTYAMLEDYYIGELKVESSESDISITAIENGTTEEKVVPYNLIIPLLITLILYWGTYFIFKKKSLKKFNAFWNTVLLLTFVIPSFGFGIYMMLQYRFPKLREINFDFMYWHVELSVVMGVIALSHFIQRINQYLVQLRK
jgi:cytochrome b involved in lipid metabolism